MKIPVLFIGDEIQSYKEQFFSSKFGHLYQPIDPFRVTENQQSQEPKCTSGSAASAKLGTVEGQQYENNLPASEFKKFSDAAPYLPGYAIVLVISSLTTDVSTLVKSLHRIKTYHDLTTFQHNNLMDCLVPHVNRTTNEQHGTFMSMTETSGTKRSLHSQIISNVTKYVYVLSTNDSRLSDELNGQLRKFQFTWTVHSITELKRHIASVLIPTIGNEIQSTEQSYKLFCRIALSEDACVTDVDSYLIFAYHLLALYQATNNPKCMYRIAREIQNVIGTVPSVLFNRKEKPLQNILGYDSSELEKALDTHMYSQVLYIDEYIQLVIARLAQSCGNYRNTHKLLRLILRLLMIMEHFGSLNDPYNVKSYEQVRITTVSLSNLICDLHLPGYSIIKSYLDYLDRFIMSLLCPSVITDSENSAPVDNVMYFHDPVFSSDYPVQKCYNKSIAAKTTAIRNVMLYNEPRMTKKIRNDYYDSKFISISLGKNGLPKYKILSQALPDEWKSCRMLQLHLVAISYPSRRDYEIDTYKIDYNEPVRRVKCNLNPSATYFVGHGGSNLIGNFIDAIQCGDNVIRIRGQDSHGIFLGMIMQRDKYWVDIEYPGTCLCSPFLFAPREARAKWASVGAGGILIYVFANTRVMLNGRCARGLIVKDKGLFNELAFTYAIGGYTTTMARIIVARIEDNYPKSILKMLDEAAEHDYSYIEKDINEDVLVGYKRGVVDTNIYQPFVSLHPAKPMCLEVKTYYRLIDSVEFSNYTLDLTHSASRSSCRERTVIKLDHFIPIDLLSRITIHVRSSMEGYSKIEFDVDIYCFCGLLVSGDQLQDMENLIYTSDGSIGVLFNGSDVSEEYSISLPQSAIQIIQLSTTTMKILGRMKADVGREGKITVSPRTAYVFIFSEGLLLDC